ncbi:hypothetical protein TWF281_007647 [Arthrobotrys megalospora]
MHSHTGQWTPIQITIQNLDKRHVRGCQGPTGQMVMMETILRHPGIQPGVLDVCAVGAINPQEYLSRMLDLKTFWQLAKSCVVGMMGNSITAYQEALNRIPQKLRELHPTFEWSPAVAQGRWSMTWNKPAPDSDPAPMVERYLVPGTKEPYYLEGPSQGRDLSWDPFLLGGAAGWDGKGSYKTKRAVADPPKDGETENDSIS